MPTTRKQGALPQAGLQKGNNNEISEQLSTAAPKPTGRRSERIRAQELLKAHKLSVHKPATTKSPGETTRETKARRRKLRKLNSGGIKRSPNREVVTPRDRSSATAPSLPAQDQTKTRRTQEVARESIQETSALCRLQDFADYDPDPQKLRLCSRLDSWLEEVRVSPVADVDPFFSDLKRLGSSSDMARSTSYSTEESAAASERQSTVNPDRTESARREAKKVSLAEGLRTRLVEFEERVDDPKTADLKVVIITKAGAIQLEQTTLLRNKIELFLSNQNDANIYDTVEELSDAINEWKSTVQMATITNRDFERDLEHCKHPSNAAVFQRTVMMSILNRHQISDKFDFNCEGAWSLRSNYYVLPSTEENTIPAPKPDLAIFFRFKSLVGRGPYQKSTPIPDGFKACMSPDGSINRCFPFIFIEAKKGFHDLTPALMANMHSASQALFNIYIWMSAAGHQDAFFSDVRLFSIAINAKEFALRVHRAQAVEEGEGLEFYYDDICDGHGYKRDHICNLIRNVLVGYAEKTLLGVLKQSVSVVLRNARQMQAHKRKSEVAGLVDGDPLSNKKTNIAISNQILDPSGSFGISQVAI
ncbi:hypothetical protein F5B22DRAFT_602325 [Xylaria bambusicola]|uniref:uncharacterized protein n=1 Tax=Xylaria bambusicola TaxID=326684 RepID=UPI002007212F|nr:uncharacterized protein F5B22DRAFT_602325 [Xylaria bambusicola]KAI0517765.1 hypothetical protein F5B22DRAFT_602325 [Xylaria bambusicola]